MSIARTSLLALSIAGVTGFLVSLSNAWELRECGLVAAPSAKELGSLGARCMSQGERRVSAERLNSDAGVITNAYGELAASNERTGVKDERMLENFAATWAKIRWEDQRKPLETKALIGGSGYGRLTVISKPPEASVDVNNERWKDPTNTSQWTPEGAKEIVLKKDKCNDERGSVTVAAGREKKFERVLQCNK